MPQWMTQLAQQIRREGFLMSLMIGSILLSIASFYTTHDGMLNFMPQPLIAFCITFAVQALLFVTSWRIGFDLAAERGWPMFTMFVFATSFCGSVFFSWVALFDAINDEDLQQRTRITRVHSALEETIVDLRARAVERRQEAAEALIETDEYDRWRADVEQVAEQALAGRETLEEVLRERARSRAQATADIEAQIAALQAESERRSAERESGESGLKQALEQRPTAVERVARLRAELLQADDLVALKQAEMDAEEAGAAGQGRGQGPIWRGLRDERDQLTARASGQRRLLANAEADLAALDTRIREFRGVIGASAGDGEAQLQGLTTELERLKNQGSAAGAAGFDLSTEVRSLRDSLAEFEARQDVAQFTRAAGQCASLLSEMRRQPALAADVGGLSCAPQRMGSALNPIEDAAAALAAIERRCVQSGADSKRIGSLGFTDAIAYGRFCVSIAGLQADGTADLRAEIDRIELEEDPNASAFVKTMNAFMGGEKLSYFALAIAISIDALVLFSGLVGAQNRGTLERRWSADELLSQMVHQGVDGAEPDLKRARKRLQLILHHAEPRGRQGIGRRGRTRPVDIMVTAPQRSAQDAAETERRGTWDQESDHEELRVALKFCALAGWCARVKPDAEAADDESEDPTAPLHYRFMRGALNDLVQLLSRLDAMALEAAQTRDGGLTVMGKWRKKGRLRAPAENRIPPFGRRSSS